MKTRTVVRPQPLIRLSPRLVVYRRQFSTTINRDSWTPVLEATRHPTWSRDYFSL